MKRNKNLIKSSELDPCVHCGICLHACPTYQVTQDETLSPRGRVQMLKRAFSEENHNSKELNNILQSCLVCGECSRACPNGIRPDVLVIEQRALKTLEYGVKKWEKWLLENIFISPQAVYSHFKAFKDVMPLSFLIPLKIVKNMRNNFPGVSQKPFSEILPPGIYRSEEENRKNKKVFFFEGCVMGALMAEESKASVLLLQQMGWDVVIQKQESCCGALQINRGEFELAADMAVKQIKSIPFDEVDFVVTDCAGCSKTLSDYKNVFFHSGELSKQAEELANKTLHLLDLIPSELFLQTPKTVFHRPCQYDKKTKIAQLYKSKIGCCGGAGIFPLIEKELSEKIINELKDEILESGIERVVASNPGCYFTLKRSLGEKTEYLSQYFSRHAKGEGARNKD